jgi:hypothetical protein
MRTLDDILQSIRADFVGNLTLRDLYGLDPDRTFDEQFSQASIEAVFSWITAGAIYLYEKIVEDKKNEITAQIASEYPFSVAWYYNRAREFQRGYTLVFDENTYRFSYPEIDESARIIKHVAVRQIIADGITKLKIYSAKENKAMLTASEFEAFKAYMTQIGAAGTHFEFVPPTPVDQLRLKYTVYRDPQVLNSQGERLSGGGRPVNEAIERYLDTIKYGGLFVRTKSVDAIQAADGVVDVLLDEIILNNVSTDARSFDSPSGFFEAQEIEVTYITSYED